MPRTPYVINTYLLKEGAVITYIEKLAGKDLFLGIDTLDQIFIDRRWV